MILVTNDIPINVKNIEKDNSGRFLLMECIVNDIEYILVNLYAPTSDKRCAQKSFGELVYSNLHSHVGKSIIVGGDLNICLDNTLKIPSNLNKSYLDSLERLMQNLNMVDIWRLKHPNTVRYTRREKTRSGFTQSRIDHFLISCHLEFSVVSTDMVPGLKLDHSLLKLSFCSNKDHIRGKGF